MPIDPLSVALLGGGLSGGLDIAGGLLSNHYAKDQQQSNFAFQREMAKYGIRWRVEDAEAAGLHPLSVLGSAFASGSPVVFEDSIGPAISRAGQSLGNAISRTQTPAEVEAAALENEWKRAQIKRTEMDTMLMGIQAADIGRRMQEANGAPGPGDLSSSIVIEGQQPKAPNQGMVEVVPPKRPSQSIGVPSLEAGQIPGFQTYMIPGLGPFDLPSSGEGLSEVMENVGVKFLPLIIGINKRKYGRDYTNRAIGMLLGRDPDKGSERIPTIYDRSIKEGARYYSPRGGR